MTPRRLLAFVLVVVLVLGAGAAAAWSTQLERAGLLILLGALVIAPIVVRVVQRRWDPFEPIVPISIAVLFLFVIRPLAHLSYGEMLYRGFDITRGFNGALMIGLVGTVALYVGYAATHGRLAQRLPSLPERWDPTTAGAFAVGLVALGLLLYLGFAATSGGTTVVVKNFSGRSTQDAALLANSSAYLYTGPYLAIPATLLLLESRARRRSVFLVVAAAVAALIALVITGPRGDRSWILPLALGAIMLPYLRRGTRPRVAGLLLGGFVAFILIVFFVEVRTIVDRHDPASTVFLRTATGLTRDWKKLILGPDTEMFSVSSLLYERTPERLPHRPGITVTSLLAAPVPRQLWSDKPFSADQYIFSNILPLQARYTRAGTAPSMFGGFFYDFGFIGVAIYSFFIGAGARTLFEYFRANRSSAGVRLVYAASFPLIIVLLRGNLTDTVPRALYLVGPVLVALWFCSQRLSPAAQSRPAGTDPRQKAIPPAWAP